MPLDPLVQLQVASSVGSAVAILATVTRLYIRRGRYWWDDACAGVAIVLQGVQLVGVFLHLLVPSTSIAGYYIMIVNFETIVWLSRLSILYSIIRIDPVPACRRILHCVALLYVMSLAVLVVQIFWVCESAEGWKAVPMPQCSLPKQVPILQLITDILADSHLVYVPLKLLSALSSADKMRRRLMFLFCASAITSTVSIAHVILILHHARIRILIAAVAENSVSLVACNILVLASAIMRRWFKDEDDRSLGQGQELTWKPVTHPPSIGSPLEACVSCCKRDSTRLEGKHDPFTDRSMKCVPMLKLRRPSVPASPSPDGKSGYHKSADEGSLVIVPDDQEDTFGDLSCGSNGGSNGHCRGATGASDLYDTSTTDLSGIV